MTPLPKSKRGQHISVPNNNKILKKSCCKEGKSRNFKKGHSVWSCIKKGRKIGYFLWIIDYNSLYGNYPIC